MVTGFDAKRAFHNRSGLGNYSRNLLKSFFRHYPENEYILYSPAGKNMIEFAGRENYILKSPEKPLHRVFPSLWRTKEVSRQVIKDGADIFHGLSSELPLSLDKSKIKTLVTVHDLIYLRYPDLYRRIDRDIYYRKTKYACVYSDHIIAISEQTKSDIINYMGVIPSRISVIYQDCHPSFYNTPGSHEKEEIKRKYSLPGNYLLYVGTIEERKNLLTLIRALEISNIDIPLVVVGRKTSYFKTVAEYIRKNRIRNIIFLEEVENTDLPAIYQGSSCFIYPSVFEGFGIPIIEALVSAVPVITSKGSCFREAGGPGSEYIDPADPAELAEALLKVTGDTSAARMMISKGKEHAKKFRAELIAGQYMDLYRSLTG